jgi:hypothetical protein
MNERAAVAHVFPPCPACGSRAVVRIAYGYPSAEMWEQERRGEVTLGGCVVGPESPAYECRGCHLTLPWPEPR